MISGRLAALAALLVVGGVSAHADSNNTGTIHTGDGSVMVGSIWVGSAPGWVPTEDAGGPTFQATPHSCYANFFGTEVSMPGCEGLNVVFAAPTYHFWSFPTPGATCVQPETGPLECSGRFDITVYGRFGNFGGRVTQHPSGLPAPFQPVRAYVWGTCALAATAVSDADGNYRFPPIIGPNGDKWGLPVNADGGGNPAWTRFSSGPGSARYLLSTGSCSEGVLATTYSSQIVNVDLSVPMVSGPADPLLLFDLSTDQNAFLVMPSTTSLPSTVSVRARVVDGLTGVPIAGATVNLELNPVPNSGGHHHNPGRPSGVLSPASGTTDATGWFQTTYTAPLASEDVFVSGTCTSPAGRSCPQTTALGRVRFCCLVPVNPGVPAGRPGRHPFRFWGSAELADRLSVLANAYANAYPGSVLGVNDASLEWGGLFDIKDDWAPPHKSHRWGDNVDIRIINVPRSRRPDLYQMCDDAGLKVLIEKNPPHWHLTVHK